MAADRRYYKAFYTRDGHQCVLQHSNRVCLVCLGPSHPLLFLQPSPEILSVEFKANKPTTNRPSGGGGAGKEKAHNRVSHNSVISTVKAKSGESFQLRSCVKGTVVDVNDQLFEEPSLLIEETKGRGYLAIILPDMHKDQINFSTSNNLIPEEEFLSNNSDSFPS